MARCEYNLLIVYRTKVEEGMIPREWVSVQEQIWAASPLEARRRLLDEYMESDHQVREIAILSVVQEYVFNCCIRKHNSTDSDWTTQGQIEKAKSEEEARRQAMTYFFDKGYLVKYVYLVKQEEQA